MILQILMGDFWVFWKFDFRCVDARQNIGLWQQTNASPILGDGYHGVGPYTITYYYYVTQYSVGQSPMDHLRN